MTREQNEWMQTGAPPRDAKDGSYERWQQWLLGKRVAETTVGLRVRLAAINGHKCVDAADHIAVAINRLECAYALLGYEPPPGDER